MNYVKCFVIAAVIASAIAMWNQGNAFKFASGIEACASFSQDASTTCDSVLGYECFGNSYFYSASRSCLDRFHQTDFDCACVTFENLECYDFGGIESCSQLYYQLPKSVRTSYFLAVLSFATSTALLIVIAVSLRYHSSNINTEGYTVVAPLQVFDTEDEGL